MTIAEQFALDVQKEIQSRIETLDARKQGYLAGRAMIAERLKRDLIENLKEKLYFLGDFPEPEEIHYRVGAEDERVLVKAGFTIAGHPFSVFASDTITSLSRPAYSIVAEKAPARDLTKDLYLGPLRFGKSSEALQAEVMGWIVDFFDPFYDNQPNV